MIQANPKELKLLELNARFMRHEEFQRLVANVKNDGRLTSVPFACLDPADGKYLVLSGNHRTKAAIAAGLKEIDLMVTDDPLTEDEKIAIQLSHNSIAGEDDPAILKILYEKIGNVDLKAYSGLDDKTLELLDKVQPCSISEANLDFQTVNLTFLPEELGQIKNTFDEAKRLVKSNEHWVTSM
jgi:hypothetical protein